MAWLNGPEHCEWTQQEDLLYMPPFGTYVFRDLLLFSKWLSPFSSLPLVNMFSYSHVSEDTELLCMCMCKSFWMHINELVNFDTCDDEFLMNLWIQHILQPLMKPLHPGVTFHYCVRMKYQHVLSFLMLTCHYLHLFIWQTL